MTHLPSLRAPLAYENYLYSNAEPGLTQMVLWWLDFWVDCNELIYLFPPPQVWDCGAAAFQSRPILPQLCEQVR